MSSREKQKKPDRQQKNASRFQTGKFPTITISDEIGALSVGEFESVITDLCSTASVEYLIGLCSKYELYNGLWFLEKRNDLVEIDQVPLFVRYMLPYRNTPLRKMIRDKIYRLEKEAFDNEVSTAGEDPAIHKIPF